MGPQQNRGVDHRLEEKGVEKQRRRRMGPLRPNDGKEKLSTSKPRTVTRTSGDGLLRCSCGDGNCTRSCCRILGVKKNILKSFFVTPEFKILLVNFYAKAFAPQRDAFDLLQKKN